MFKKFLAVDSFQDQNKIMDEKTLKKRLFMLFWAITIQFPYILSKKNYFKYHWSILAGCVLEYGLHARFK